MLPVVKDNNVDEEAQLDARIERVRRLLGQFEVDEQDSFSAFYDGEEEFVYNDYSDSFEDFRSPEDSLIHLDDDDNKHDKLHLLFLGLQVPQRFGF